MHFQANLKHKKWHSLETPANNRLLRDQDILSVLQSVCLRELSTSHCWLVPSDLSNPEILIRRDQLLRFQTTRGNWGIRDDDDDDDDNDDDDDGNDDSDHHGTWHYFTHRCSFGSSRNLYSPRLRGEPKEHLRGRLHLTRLKSSILVVSRGLPINPM